MITPWDVYWITRLDGIGVLLVALIVVLAVGSFICVVIGDIAHDEPFRYKKIMSVSFAILFACMILKAFVPTTNEAVAIYMIPKIANNEQVQKLPDNAVRFLNGKFEKWINDMADKKKEK